MGRREEAIRLAFGGPKVDDAPEPELTEDRVREIVREELANAVLSGGNCKNRDAS